MNRFRGTAPKNGEADTEPRLQQNIWCFAFNGNNSQVAISPNNKTILIYSVVGGLDSSPENWKLLHTLDDHDSFVSGLDQSPKTNLIASCGHDRNAYVQRYENGKQNPTLVILRINRAANFVKQSPDGNKFAVASAAKVVPVCHYEESNNWWVSKMIKKHKSTILTLDWHRNNNFLITGGTDYKCRIFSAFIPEVDTNCDTREFAQVFKEQFKFGAMLAEFGCSNGQVESVCQSPSGFRAAFVGHDSTISFIELQGAVEKGDSIQTQCIKFKELPFNQVEFLGDNCVVAAGHECNPYLFVKNEETFDWEFSEKVDKGKGGKKKTATGGSSSGKVASSFAKNRFLFQETTSKGKDAVNAKGGSSMVKLVTRHQNQITCLRSMKSDSPSSSFYTSGQDGRLLYWNLSDLEINLSKLRIS